MIDHTNLMGLLPWLKVFGNNRSHISNHLTPRKDRNMEHTRLKQRPQTERDEGPLSNIAARCNVCYGNQTHVAGFSTIENQEIQSLGGGVANRWINTKHNALNLGFTKGAVENSRVARIASTHRYWMSNLVEDLCINLCIQSTIHN